MAKKANPLKELARLEFVAKSLTIGEIAEKLDIPFGSVARWSYEGAWVKERDRLQQGVEVVSNPQPPVEAEENQLFQKWESLSADHEKSYAEIKRYASAQIRSLTRNVAKLQAQGDSESLLAIAMSPSAAKCAETWARILDTAIKGERVACSLEYLDLNRAIRLLKYYGYEIVQAPIEESPSIEPPGLSPETRDRILRESLGVTDSANFN